MRSDGSYQTGGPPDASRPACQIQRGRRTRRQGMPDLTAEGSKNSERLEAASLLTCFLDKSTDSVFLADFEDMGATGTKLRGLPTPAGKHVRFDDADEEHQR